MEELSIFKVLAELLDDSFNALGEGVALYWPGLVSRRQFLADLMAEVSESRFVAMSVVVRVVCLDNRVEQSVHP